MDKENLISIWTAYSEQANELTNKRLTFSSLFLTITAALLGICIPYFGLTSLVISSIGILLCILWFLTLLSFKRLSSAKFKVIAEIERNMKIQPYNLEWEFAKKYKHLKITTTEMIITIVIGIGYICVLAFSVLKVANKI